MAGKLTYFLEGNSLLPSSHFLFCKGLGTCDALPTLSHPLQVALDRAMKERLVQLGLSAAFHRVTHRGRCIS